MCCMDVHTKEQRSYNMSRIPSKNTKPELLLFKSLRKAGLKFKKHYPITGKPDAVFPNEKLAVFVDGEYWHGKDFDQWKNRLSEFWFKKIGQNIKRDRRIRSELRKGGWLVLRIWGRDLIRQPDRYLRKIQRMVLSVPTTR